jgi:hypothetical protein
MKSFPWNDAVAEQSSGEFKVAYCRDPVITFTRP